MMLLLAMSCVAQAPVVTGIFFDLLGKVSSNGEPAPVGGIVTACSESGVLCGQCRIKIPGFFGVMHVYVDDPKTVDPDGVKQGERLSLFLDGHPLASDREIFFSTPYESTTLTLTDGISDVSPPSIKAVTTVERGVHLSFSEPVNHLTARDTDSYDCATSITGIVMDRDLCGLTISFEETAPASLVIRKLSDIFGNFVENVPVRL